ncbi:MAG: hypothetical protein ACLR0F_26725 [Eisenbergiella sp.]
MQKALDETAFGNGYRRKGTAVRLSALPPMRTVISGSEPGLNLPQKLPDLTSFKTIGISLKPYLDVDIGKLSSALGYMGWGKWNISIIDKMESAFTAWMVLR